MTRPPLHSQTNPTSPAATAGATGDMSNLNTIDANAEGGVNSMASYHSLLDKAQKFSMFAVHHVEEVRQALLNTADAQGKNSTEINAAFEELTAAYDKLSMSKWNSARIEYEDVYRDAEPSMDRKYTKSMSSLTNASAEQLDENDGKVSTAEKRVKMNPTTTLNRERTRSEASTRGLKVDHPWQDDDDMNPEDWISDAFLKAAISDEDEDEGGDSFPAAANGTAAGHVFRTTAAAAQLPPATPPGFKSDRKMSIDTEGHQTAHTKTTMRSVTSMGSEVSSLHTNQSHDGDEDSDDLDDDYSDTSSSSSDEDEESLPSLDNFDYVYKGGYAMRAEGGKETKGVVPKTVKLVLVDPSVKSIEDGAFQGCKLLESITIPSSCEAVGDNAFRKCSKLKNVTFLTKANKVPGLRKKLDSKKEDTTKLPHRRSLSAPSSVTEPRSSKLRSIGEWAFFNCSSLSFIKLPYGLTNIGARAFQRCSSMSLTELPMTLVTVGENAFVGTLPETKAAYERWEKDHQSK